MKTISILPAILSLLLLSPAISGANDGVITYDVSGDRGDKGDSGRSSYSRDSRTAEHGSSGQRAEDGEDAGIVEAEIGFVPGTDGKEVYIKGTRRQSPKDRPSTFDERIKTNELKNIRFQANGGAGGTGGHGGNGEKGNAGRAGADITYVIYNLDGDDGEDGQDGGYGGDGGQGGRGGNAGILRIKLAPGAELLSPLVKAIAEAGPGGSGGNGGEGGKGGRGGGGGEGICEDGSRNDFVIGGYKQIDTGRRDDSGNIIYESIRCGEDGRDGKPGKDGRDGRQGTSGADGNKGDISLTYADGKTVNGGYKLRAANWVIEESVKDGVIEPKEDFRAKAVVFENTGKDSVPAANYRLALPNGKEISVAMKTLPPGAKREVSLDSAIALEAPVSGEAAIPLEVKLNHVDPNVGTAPTFPVQQPVEIVQVNGLDLTSKKREGELVFRVTNLSNKSYGAQGEIKRALKLQLQSEQGTPPLVKVNGKFQPLAQALDLDIPKIGAGETRLMKVKVRVPDNWKPGQGGLLGSSLSIEGSKVAPVKSNDMRISFKIDRNDKISKNFSVKDLGVTCQYYRALWFNYGVESVSVIKPENAKYVEVRVQLDGGKMSPVYKIALNEVPTGFLENVLNERPFTSDQLVAFLQTLEHPGHRGLITDGSKWNVRSCYAAENRTGQADPESYAAEQASRINTVNSSEGSEYDPRVIHNFVGQKKGSAGGSSQEENRDQKKAGDAR